MGAKYRSQYVFASVLYICLLMYQKPHVHTSLNFLNVLPVAMAWSFSDYSAVRYMLAVLWMT